MDNPRDPQTVNTSLMRPWRSDFGPLPGRKKASENGSQGEVEPLKSSLPNSQIFISNLHCQMPRVGLVFLGFWGLSKVNPTFIYENWNR
jgi:hypothetical protein